MSSSEENKTVAPKKPVKKDRKSIGWIIGVVVLILISITFILPTTIFSMGNTGDQVLGVYDGKKIKLSDTYLQNQMSMLSQQYGSQVDPTQILMQAYQTTVFAKALESEAEKAGYKVTDEVIDQIIIDSGYYNNEEGVFDVEKYNSTDKLTKDMLRSTVSTQLPAMAVTSDVSSIKTSDAELEIIKQLSAITREFEYALIDSSTYPAEMAEEYAMSNPQPFMQAGLSILTVADEESAKTIASDIANGTTTFEEAVASSSTDSYKDKAGNMGEVFYFELQNMFIDKADADVVFSTAIGSTTEPMQTLYGWSIFKMDSAIEMADFTDAETVKKANSYIATADSEMMKAYLDETTATFSSRVADGEDFNAVAEEMGVQVVQVAGTNPNPAGFPLLSSFSYTDPSYYLYYATSSDKELVKTLYSSEEGTVLPSVSVNGANIVVKVGAEKSEADENMGEYVSTIYPMLSASMIDTDLQNSIFSSSKFEDNFYEILFSQLLAGNN